MPRKLLIPSSVALWPALSRFYGLSFTELRKMPRWAIRLYVDEMHVLHAQEQIDALEVVSFPYMEDGDRSALGNNYNAIIRRAQVERRAAGVESGAPRELTPLPDRGALAGAGIAMVKEAPSA